MTFCDLDGYAKRTPPQPELQQPMPAPPPQQQLQGQQAQGQQEVQQQQQGHQEEAGELAVMPVPSTTMSRAASLGITLPGTDAYMAPEVYNTANASRGIMADPSIAAIEAAEVAKDPACDIWSLGAVLMEMLVRPGTRGSRMEPCYVYAVGTSKLPCLTQSSSQPARHCSTHVSTFGTNHKLTCSPGFSVCSCLKAQTPSSMEPSDQHSA
jgi:serine/threonine protein kinase